VKLLSTFFKIFLGNLVEPTRACIIQPIISLSFLLDYKLSIY